MVHLNLEFPEHFFEEEIRDGYTVPAKMKEVWAVELDLLNELMQVCKKHHVKYYAAGGTMLGAIRHHGMVPWDDDIDVMLPRQEFDRLCEIAPIEFSHPYFFQTEDTDPGSYRGHAQLRNSETTGILASGYDDKRQINQGIFIDIFPLDNVPDDEVLRTRFYIRLKRLRRKYHGFVDRSLQRHYKRRTNWIKNLYNDLWYKFPLLASKVAKWYYSRFLKESMVCNRDDTLDVVMTPFYEARWTWSRRCFESQVEVPFEMLTIPVPSAYEVMLEKTYGDWQKFVVGGSVHGGVIFDTNRPYTEYIKEQ